MMKHLAAVLVAVAAVLSAQADPSTVSGVTMTQDPASRIVTVSYELTGGEAIVTAALTVNGAEVAGKTDTVAGEINRRLPSGIHAFTWLPDREGFPADLSAVGFKLVAWPVATPPDYMAVDLLSPSNVCYYASAGLVPYGVSNALYKTQWLLMRKIPAAKVRWRQGTASPGKNSAEQICRYVTLTEDYYIGVYEMTHRQCKNIHGKSYSAGGLSDDDMLPAYASSYETLRGPTSGHDWPTDGHEVSATSVLGEMRALTGLAFDLPTGAQWEYACRAGTSGSTYGTLDEIAWYSGNAPDKKPQVVGTKKQNAWGLYDMLGNAFEFCLDWMSYSAETDSAEATDPKGPSAYEDLGENRGHGGRMWRGGSTAAGYSTTASGVYTWGKVGGASSAFTGFRVWCPVK